MLALRRRVASLAYTTYATAAAATTGSASGAARERAALCASNLPTRAAAIRSCDAGRRLFSEGAASNGGAGDGTPSGSGDNNSLPGRRPGEGRDMMMVFTCTVCETRAAKTMSRKSYEEGVVLVRCPGCQNLHLIADRFGWFGEPGSIEQYLAERGEEVFRGSDDGTLSLTPEQLAGWSSKVPAQSGGEDDEQQGNASSGTQATASLPPQEPK
eukprot:jgi/Tetstr1/421195/TSEL_001101.t1